MLNPISLIDDMSSEANGHCHVVEFGDDSQQDTAASPRSVSTKKQTPICYTINVPVTIYSNGERISVGNMSKPKEELVSVTTTPTSDKALDRKSAPVVPIAEHALRQLRERLTISRTSTLMMISSFVAEMKKGLKLHGQDPNCLQDEKACQFAMLETHIENVPTGNETGIFYAVDLGGTNFRVVRIELKGEGDKVKTVTTKDCAHHSLGPDKPKGMLDPSVKASEFFGSLAGDVVRLATVKGDLTEGKALPFGFCFSFPAQVQKKNSAILTHWTKGWATGRDHVGDECIEGNDVAKLFDKSFEKLGANAQCHVVVNDTVGTLLACSYENPKRPPVYIGLILGTGANACYIEPEYKHYGYHGKVINIECGNFSHHLPLTEIDRAVDEELSAPADIGRQRLEKIMAGMYLGELSRRYILQILREKLMASPATKVHSLGSGQAAAIAQDHSPTLTVTCNILHNIWAVSLPYDELLCVQEICRLVFARSASLAAMMIAAIALKTGVLTREGCLTVAVDGSLYANNPWYQDVVREQLEAILGPEADKVYLVLTSDGSGVGAAVAVAADYQ